MSCNWSSSCGLIHCKDCPEYSIGELELISQFDTEIDKQKTKELVEILAGKVFDAYGVARHLIMDEHYEKRTTSRWISTNAPGHWAWKCEKCNSIQDVGSRYCPYCRANMMGGS